MSGLSKGSPLGNNNFNILMNNIERVLKPPVIERVTIRPGRILWHARWQPLVPSQRRNVMNSPDYLYTSPQISQAILHGLSTKKMFTVVELTKLRVTKPIHLINFKSAKEQTNYAIHMGINNFMPFSLDDVKLFAHICGKSDIDGYRAQWDQDQIALCAKVIRTKLEKVSSRNYTNKNIELGFGFSTNNINFEKSPNWSRSYYTVMGNKSRGRRLVKFVKGIEKRKAIKAKQERTLAYSFKKVKNTIKEKSTFKRPVVRPKKGI